MRLKAGLTIEELAFRCGLHHNYLGDIERGRRNPSLANLAKVAAGLSVPVRALFPNEAQPSEAPLYDLYCEMLPLVRHLRDASPADREHVLSVAHSLAKRLKKR
jgi:transcriptional regulator with XRE-family HTH domain